MSFFHHRVISMISVRFVVLIIFTRPSSFYGNYSGGPPDWPNHRSVTVQKCSILVHSESTLNWDFEAYLCYSRRPGKRVCETPKWDKMGCSWTVIFYVTIEHNNRGEDSGLYFKNNISPLTLTLTLPESVYALFCRVLISQGEGIRGSWKLMVS